MIYEEQLKEVLEDIITWTTINNKPDVKKMKDNINVRFVDNMFTRGIRC